MSDRDTIPATIEALREAFDSSFAVAPAATRPDEVALLAIRVGNDSIALRVHDTLGLVKAGRIVAVPSRRPDLVGIIGLRGAVIPIYSLARLAGLVEGEQPRWIALAGGPDRIGLAFAQFEGHLRVAPGAIHAAASPRESRLVSGVLETGGAPRTILDVPAIVQVVKAASDRRTGSPT